MYVPELCAYLVDPPCHSALKTGIELLDIEVLDSLLF